LFLHKNQPIKFYSILAFIPVLFFVRMMRGIHCVWTLHGAALLKQQNRFVSTMMLSSSDELRVMLVYMQQFGAQLKQAKMAFGKSQHHGRSSGRTWGFPIAVDCWRYRARPVYQ
jgi:hypothetical protein